jgi:sugar fermentation stimulation protein A
MPNPGRLWELLFPGVTLLLAPSRGGKMSHTVMAIESPDGPILLHTHLNNNVAGWLLENRLVPGLEDARVVRAEYPFGDSRFDFLMEREGCKVLVEVKSCTLFRGGMAMFPDAVTERGTRHLRELARAAEEGWETAVLILAHSGAVTRFLPEYHTDLDFARALIEVKDRVRVVPLGLSWGDGLVLSPEVRELDVPWDFLEREAHDSGSYLVILEVEEDRVLSVGALGEVSFSKGYYVYVGSAMKNLTKRIERHRRLRKNHHWHIDYLRQESRFVAGLAVRASERLECGLARAVEQIAQTAVPGFGSSDCSCSSHLFRFGSDPRKNKTFIDLLLDFRMTRPEGVLEGV